MVEDDVETAIWTLKVPFNDQYTVFGRQRPICHCILLLVKELTVGTSVAPALRL